MLLEHLLELLLIFTLHSIVQLVVNLFHILAHTDHDLLLQLRGQLLLCLPFEALHDSLSLLDVASPGHLRALVEIIPLQEICIAILI